jgi:hypothetical protein
MALSQNHYLGIDLPVDKNDPTTLLWQFRTQFGMSPEVARPLHNLLETKGSVVYFLYNTASLLERDFTEEEHRQHDQQLARVCGFLRRNFPHLTFQVIALFANRLWSLPEKPPELLVFCLNTPYVFRKKTHFHLFLQSASEWFRLLVSG